MTSAKRISFLLVVALTFILASTQFAYAEEKFRVNNDNKEATAILVSKSLKVDMALGDASDYSNFKKFDLVVGGCTVSIEGTRTWSSSIKFSVKENEQPKGNIDNPKSFEATSSNVKMLGQDNAGDPKTISLCESGVNFDEHPKDKSKYLVEVQISGDVPSRFELSSEALLYTSTAQKILKGASLVAIIIASTIVSLCVSSSIGVSAYFGYRKWKSAKEEPAIKQELMPMKDTAAKEESHPAKYMVKKPISSKGLRKKRSAQRNKKIPVEKTVEVNVKGLTDTKFDNSRDRETAMRREEEAEGKTTKSKEPTTTKIKDTQGSADMDPKTF